MEKQHKFSIWYFLLVFFALMFLQRYFFLSHVQDITYSEFRKLVQANKVNELVISGSIIRGKLAEGAVDVIEGMRGDPSVREHFQKMKEEGHSFSTVRMEDSDLVKVLEDHRIQYTAQLENTWFTRLLSWIVPMLIFFGIWGLIMKRMGTHAGEEKPLDQ